MNTVFTGQAAEIETMPDRNGIARFWPRANIAGPVDGAYSVVWPEAHWSGNMNFQIKMATQRILAANLRRVRLYTN